MTSTNKVPNSTDFSNLTEAQLLLFLKLRLKNINYNIKLTHIVLSTRRYVDGIYLVEYLVSSADFSTEIIKIYFDKFFVNEFLVLQKFSIIFKK